MVLADLANGLCRLCQNFGRPVFFGESVEETLKDRETSEEANGAKARFTEAAPSAKEVEERNLNHSALGVGARTA